MEKIKIDVYTDGSCLGNPGVGGFAAIMESDGVEKICKGYSPNPRQTNNRMELMPVLHVLKWCSEVQKKSCELKFYTDSQYLVSCWENHDEYWLMTGDRPNRDLWVQIIKLCKKHGHTISFVKVQGHSGNEKNERVDKLAREMAVKARHVAFGGMNGRK